MGVREERRVGVMSGGRGGEEFRMVEMTESANFRSEMEKEIERLEHFFTVLRFCRKVCSDIFAGVGVWHWGRKTRSCVYIFWVLFTHVNTTKYSVKFYFINLVLLYFLSTYMSSYCLLKKYINLILLYLFNIKMLKIWV